MISRKLAQLNWVSRSIGTDFKVIDPFLEKSSSAFSLSRCQLNEKSYGSVIYPIYSGQICSFNINQTASQFSKGQQSE